MSIMSEIRIAGKAIRKFNDIANNKAEEQPGN